MARYAGAELPGLLPGISRMGKDHRARDIFPDA